MANQTNSTATPHHSRNPLGMKPVLRRRKVVPLFLPSSSPPSSPRVSSPAVSRPVSPVSTTKQDDSGISNTEASPLLPAQVARRNSVDPMEIPEPWVGLFGPVTSLLTGLDEPDRSPAVETKPRGDEPKQSEPARYYCGFRSPPRSVSPPLYSLPDRWAGPDHPLWSQPLAAQRHSVRASSFLHRYWILRRVYEGGPTVNRPALAPATVEKKLCELREQLTDNLMASERIMREEMAAHGIPYSIYTPCTGVLEPAQTFCLLD